jgi:hypothetical protein
MDHLTFDKKLNHRRKVGGAPHRTVLHKFVEWKDNIGNLDKKSEIGVVLLSKIFETTSNQLRSILAITSVSKVWTVVGSYNRIQRLLVLQQIGASDPRLHENQVDIKKI